MIQEIISLPDTVVGWTVLTGGLGTLGYKILQILRRDGAEDGVIKMLREQLASSDMRNKQTDTELIALHVTLKIIRDDLTEARVQAAALQIKIAALTNEVHQLRRGTRASDAANTYPP